MNGAYLSVILPLSPRDWLLTCIVHGSVSVGMLLTASGDPLLTAS